MHKPHPSAAIVVCVTIHHGGPTLPKVTGQEPFRSDKTATFKPCGDNVQKKLRTDCILIGNGKTP